MKWKLSDEVKMKNRFRFKSADNFFFPHQFYCAFSITAININVRYGKYFDPSHSLSVKLCI